MDAVNIVADFVSLAKQQWPNGKEVGSPTIDSNAPVGKRQLWTYGSGQANIAKIYFGKTDRVLATAFGQPASWKMHGIYFVYTYDKMRVRGPQNMQYSKVYFIVKPDSSKGRGKVVQVRLDPASGLPI